MENMEYEAGVKIRIGRPAIWNAEFNNHIRDYFEKVKNIISCHMAWVVVENPGEVPHFVLSIRAGAPNASIGNDLVKYCNEKMKGRVPLTDMVYDQGDAISKMIRIVGKRIYPKRKFGIL